MAWQPKQGKLWEAFARRLLSSHDVEVEPHEDMSRGCLIFPVLRMEDASMSN